MRLWLALAMVLAATAARAATLPAWVVGRWNAVGVMQSGEFSGFGEDRANAILKYAQRLAIDMRPDVVTSVPSELYELLEADGLSAVPAEGRFQDLYTLDKPYQALGQPINVEAQTLIPYVTITAKHCLLNPANGLAMTRGGHSAPPRYSAACPPFRVYQLTDGLIGWDTDMGWLVLERGVLPAAKP